MAPKKTVSINKDIEINVSLKDLFKKMKLSDTDIGFDVNVPNSFFQTLLEQFFERDYLDVASDKVFDYTMQKNASEITWVQIERLPIHPSQNEDYDLLTRWQGVLSCLHVWGYRLIFLLLRQEGKTKIYLGTVSSDPNITSKTALKQIQKAAAASMPGIGLRQLSNEKDESGFTEKQRISLTLNDFESVGAVTGIPSFKKTENNTLIQTLDPLAMGIRDVGDAEDNYALMVISEPISDDSITDIISNMRSLSSKIHMDVKKNVNERNSISISKKEHGSALALMSTLGSIFGMSGLGSTIGGIFGLDAQKQIGGDASVGSEVLDKFAQYAETVADSHVERLTEGRNYGFWNSGVYVFGSNNATVGTVTGMLRSIYSGDETYLEPIRLHMFRSDSHAKEIISTQFRLLPLVDIELSQEASEYAKNKNANDGEKPFDPNAEKQWHLLGTEYQYISTPVNTKELSLLTSLPRRDVPGLRFVKTAVRFANNPPAVEGETIKIGSLVDMGIIQNMTYDIDPNSLVRHALIAGSTGCGKSTTCKRILQAVMNSSTPPPIMVIEPAKDDYVRWALKMNKTLPDDKKFKIYMPGVTEFEGTKFEELKINGYAPAYYKGAKVDLLQHSETYATLLNACLPSEDVIPILIEEVVYEQLKELCDYENIDYMASENAPLKKYPDIDHMIKTAEKVMDRKNYEDRVKSNMREVLATRFKSLKRGMRGRIMNVTQSVDYDELFSGNVIINLSRLWDAKDKALVMSLVMNALYEYRISRFKYDDEYRKAAEQNRLLHLCLVEEAHNVLLKPQGYVSSGSPQNAVANLFGNMLSEVRGYGQGFMIVDQVPTRLIDDVIKNTNYKIVHRLTAPDDQEVMAKCMAFRPDQISIIPALEKGNAIICGDEDDAAVWIKIPKPDR